MIVLDTHAWIWWVNSPDALGAAGRQAIDEAGRGNALHVSTISVWEVVVLVQKGRLAFTIDVRDWIARCQAIPFLHFVPLTVEIAIEAARLPESARLDPADRIIVATALSLGARLATRDEKIRSFPSVQTVW